MKTGHPVLFLILDCLLVTILADNNNGDGFNEFIESRKLRSAGYQHFEHSAIYEVIKSSEKGHINGESIRHKRSIGEGMDLEFKAFGEIFQLRLNHAVSVLHPQAKVIVSNGNTEKEWVGTHPDCYLTGYATSHGGTVSMSYCNQLIGGISTKNHSLHIESLPDHMQNRSGENPEHTPLLVARKPHTWSRPIEDPSYIDRILNGERIYHPRHRRAIQSTSFTLEMAIYTDAEFTTRFPFTDVVDRINLMVVKYNGVQMEWGRVDILGYNVTIELKYMHFYETDPAGYNTSTTLLVNMMASFCTLKQGSLAYDSFYLHVGKQNLDVSGRAYLNAICKQNINCAADNILGFTEYVGTAHEIGHNFDMRHDDELGCTGTDVGNMGGYGAGWSNCSVNSLTAFLTNSDVSCLWEVNIPTADVSTPLRGLTLVPELPGQLYTPDEVCELKYGSNFRYREYPNIGVCAFHSCVDYNFGSTYGQMHYESYYISGQYCDTGKICFKHACETWATAKQTGLEVRTGGWGAWGSWAYASCSRSCGTGVQFRRRICNSPTPKNGPSCDGEEFDATACNTDRCPGDSSDTAALITDRATESCTSLIANGLVNGSLYTSSGTKFSSSGYGQCEVKCNPVDGYSTPAYTRFGLMPDGTPCSGTLDNKDTNNWPRRPGYYYMCIEGLCMEFGCDKLGGARYDECGVCGGDNSTCDAYTGVDTVQQDQGSRRTIAVLPVGAYNIEFWFSYSSMKQNFLELWTKEDNYVLAPYISYIFVYDDPVSFAGTYWYYTFNSQYLYAKGPIDQAAVIKLQKRQTNDNTGINFGYSVPLSASTCSLTCENGGTFNSTLCACMCPTGYYGNTCSSTCNTICSNEGIVNETTCGCECTDRSYGDRCASCIYPYEGEGCNTCKVTSCQNCGTFNASTCRCQCLDGYGGLECEKICEDLRSTCAAEAAAGDCETNNNDMEQNCMASCNICVKTAEAPTTMVPCEGSTLSPSTTTTAATTTPTTTTPSTCPLASYTCGNGNCVDLDMKCDGNDDCGNGSDENIHICAGCVVRTSILQVSSLALLAILLWVK